MRIDSQTLRFDLIVLSLFRQRNANLLNLLKETADQLSKQEKNYFHFEYHWVYFDIFYDGEELDGSQRDLFLDMYYFFYKNKRAISSRIYRLKKSLDRRDSLYGVFESAELVRNYSQWTIPEDFFQSLDQELKKRYKTGLTYLVVVEREQKLFEFSKPNRFRPLHAELAQRAMVSASALNLTRDAIRADCTAQEKAFYPFLNTKVFPWRISASLFAVVILAFRHNDYANMDLFEINKELFAKFAGLFVRFYENDYQVNRKLGFMVGKSPAMREMKKRMLKFSKVDYSLLITGESGTGKELVAKGVFLLSSRATGPFIAVNAAALPENLLEAELFGYRKGAFTGAMEDKMGLVEAADKGVLFLDEIGDLPLKLQAKLLRVLQEGEIRRLGETRTRPVDIRLMSATNRDLKEMMEANTFREDLYYRIQDLTLRVPPLRERLEDIPLLVDHILEKLHFTPEDPGERLKIIAQMENRQWRGNIRELESRLKRLITFYPDVSSDSRTFSLPTSPQSFKQARENFERQFILRVLAENNWNKVRTARQLDISRMALHNLIKKYHIEKA